MLFDIKLKTPSGTPNQPYATNSAKYFRLNLLQPPPMCCLLIKAMNTKYPIQKGLILYSKNYPSKFSISIVGKVTIRIAYPNTRLSSKFPKVKDLETFRRGIGIYLSLAIGIFPKEGCNLEPPTKNKSEIIFLLPQQCPDRGSKQTFLLCVHISYFWKSKVHVSALALFIFPFFDKSIILSSVALFC